MAAFLGDRYVSFIDILGFGANIEKIREHNDDTYKKIKEALLFIRNTAELTRDEKNIEDIQLCIFSDSAFISCPTGDGNRKELQIILSMTQGIAFNLLRLGFLTRGGIARGNCEHDGNTIFGEAVNRAYRLESKIANFPRIILGRGVVLDINRSKISKEQLIRKSKDGPFFVHSLWESCDYAESVIHKKKTGWEKSEETNTIRKISKVIENGLDENQDNPTNYEKYLWMADYFNDTAAKYRPELGQFWPSAIDTIPY